MTWAKLDDALPDHEKILRVGPLGLALQVKAICWSSKHLTDGFLPAHVVEHFLAEFRYGLAPESQLADELQERMIEAGLWEKNGDFGYTIHDYLDYNPSKKQVMKQRREMQAKGKRGGEASAKRRAEAQGNRPAEPPSRPVPSRPGPSRSDPEEPSPGREGDPGEDPLRPLDGFAGWEEGWDAIKARIQTLPFLDRYQAWLTDLDWWKTQDEKFEAVPATLDQLLCGAVAYITSTRYKPRTRVGLLKKLHNCLEVEARKVEREGKTREG